MNIDEQIESQEWELRKLYWFARAYAEFPKVGSLYRVIQETGISFHVSGKIKYAMPGAIMMLVWLESPNEWAVRRANLEARGVASSALLFNFQMLWEERLWEKEHYSLEGWDKSFELIHTGT